MRARAAALDADLSVAGLAAGVFGSKAWMSELARYAGSRTSARKASSSRINGKPGGTSRARGFSTNVTIWRGA